MTTSVHPTALIAQDTVVDTSLRAGAYVVVGHDGDDGPVVLGAGSVLRSHTVLYRGVRAGTRFSTGHGVLIREATVLGDDVSVGSHTVLEHHVTIGNRVRIHSSCFIPELTVLEDGAWIGPGVRITNARHPNRPETKANLEGVTVAHGAIVGAAAVLLPGIRVGEGATIGAGAVVVRDVPDGAVVVGNPGRLLDRELDPTGDGPLADPGGPA